MQLSGIDGAILMGLPWMSPELNQLTNNYIARHLQSNKDTYWGLAVLPPPGACNLLDEVKRAQDLHFSGIKVIPSWQGWQLTDEVYLPVYEYMMAEKMILFPHVDYPHNSLGRDPAAALYQIKKNFPELPVIAPHLGGGLFLCNEVEWLECCRESMLFLTSVSRNMRSVMYALDALPEGMVAFASDAPLNPSHDQLSVKSALLQLDIPEPILDSVAGKAAQAFLKRFG